MEKQVNVLIALVFFMYVVYLVRHALDFAPSKDVENFMSRLRPEGEDFAEKVMGVALRANIDEEIKQHPNLKANIEFINPYSKRVRQTKAGILKSFDGLEGMITHTREARLNPQEMGEIYGLSMKEIKQKFPQWAEYYTFLKEIGEEDSAIPPGKCAEQPNWKPSESRRQFKERVVDFKLDLLHKQYDVEAAPEELNIKVIVTSGLACNELRRSFALASNHEFLRNREHVEGSVYKFKGPVMIIMDDCGFIVSGQRGQTQQATPRGR